jgi:hypothetical protein
MYSVMATQAKTYTTCKHMVYVYQRLCQLSSKKHCSTRNMTLQYNIPQKAFAIPALSCGSESWAIG